MGHAPWTSCPNFFRLPGQTPVARNDPGTACANYILMKSIKQINGKCSVEFLGSMPAGFLNNCVLDIYGKCSWHPTLFQLPYISFFNRHHMSMESPLGAPWFNSCISLQTNHFVINASTKNNWNRSWNFLADSFKFPYQLLIRHV